MTLDEIVRGEWGRVVAALSHRFGDLDLAEDCVQDACAAALRVWPVRGVPQRPGAWLTRAAYNRAIDVKRRRATESLPDEIPGPALPEEDDISVRDDRLHLLLLCAHPALAPDARIALMLRCVLGLNTAQIAALCLANEATVAARIVRAKRKIKNAAFRFTVEPQDVAARLASVRLAIYALFTEGHTASGGDSSVRIEPLREALYLARVLFEFAPSDPENAGLFALLQLHQARSKARIAADGSIVALAQHDPSKYDRQTIAEAVDILHRTLARRMPGRFQIEAAISALHTQGVIEEHTDWPQIAALYEHLATIAPSPIVEVNRAIACARSGNAKLALELLAPVLASGLLDRYAPLHVAHADILETLGLREAALRSWNKAYEFAENPAHRAEIERRRSIASKA